MTNRQLKLVEKCSTLEPLDGRVIVLPNKVKTYKDLQFVGRPKDTEIKEQDIEPDTEMVMIEEEIDVNYRYQTAMVLKVPSDEIRFNVGDTIIYVANTAFDFDYVKGTSLIKKYDVVAVVKT